MLKAYFIIALLFSMLAVAVLFGTGEASTDVIGIISSDITWTKTSSPYILSGLVTIGNGVTLTIEAGVTVNLNGYNLDVEGILFAKGTNNDKITFNGGSQSTGLTIKDSSIISDSIFNGKITVVGTSKISNCNINGRIDVVDASPIISNNKITGVVAPDSTIIDDYIAGKFSAGNAPTDEATTGIVLRGSNNEVSIIGNTISECSAGIKVATEGRVLIRGNQISNNTVNGIEILCPTNLTIEGNLISNNTMNQIVAKVGTQSKAILTIRNNTIVNGPRSMITGIQQSIYGINLEGEQNSNTAYISHNVISGCEVAIGPATGTIERNLVTNNNDGVDVGLQAIIRNNTIVNNNRGIGGPSSSTTIIYNNIVNSSATGSIWMTNPEDVNATYNWWGTTDSQVISQGIRLHPFYPNSVTFVPFLTEPNPHAMPDSNAPSHISESSPSPTFTPYNEPQQKEQEVIIEAIITAIVIGAGLGLLIYLIKRK